MAGGRRGGRDVVELEVPVSCSREGIDIARSVYSELEDCPACWGRAMYKLDDRFECLGCGFLMSHERFFRLDGTCPGVGGPK